ncbi:heat shock 70 kDa protein 1-like [Hyalella azteca]|uniref:Heat shock 70 kDa protein 1-like n=1 Tax=Hyalella azteca TaxID=294128 RepID=A0A8B7N2M5_HYAAZ|nr:heat shock 70 kDa protein 1-like [Hyalella azteca]
MSGAVSIGLDLGAGKCCVASVRAGAVTVLPNAHGDKTTPSFVAFTDSRSLVGSDVRDQAALSPENTFYGVKTVIGRSCKKIQKNELAYITGNEVRTGEIFMMNLLPEFLITEKGSAAFKIEYRNKELMLHAEEITALLIAKMKSVAEDDIGSPVTNAVITVPVNFSNAQRQATLDAARIAGLKNVTLINSTTAAAIAYWDQHPREKDCVAVVDFGASSLSFAILSIDNGTVKVLEAYGGLAVSGNRIDFCMMRAIVTKFQEKHGKSFEESPGALVRLRTAMEKLKFNLTLLTSYVLQVDSLSHGIDFTTTFSRQEMEESCQSQFEILGNALRRWAKLKNWVKVRTIVLVGGSTRIPTVESLIAKTLRKPLDHSLNKDEAVACGAALRAAELCCSTPREVQEVLSRRVWFEADAENFDLA